MQSGQPQDAKDDVKSKPENQKNDDKPKSRMFNTVDRFKDWGILGMRLLVHNGNRTQMLADSGVIANDEANTALGTAGTMIQEQAEIDPTETSASEFTPYLLHILVHIVTHINSIVMYYSP